MKPLPKKPLIICITRFRALRSLPYYTLFSPSSVRPCEPHCLPHGLGKRRDPSIPRVFPAVCLGRTRKRFHFGRPLASSSFSCAAAAFFLAFRALIFFLRDEGAGVGAGRGRGAVGVGSGWGRGGVGVGLGCCRGAVGPASGCAWRTKVRRQPRGGGGGGVEGGNHNARGSSGSLEGQWQGQLHGKA